MDTHRHRKTSGEVSCMTSPLALASVVAAGCEPSVPKKAADIIRQMWTIDEFCQAHGGVSRATFYNLLKRGVGPRIMRVGARVFVSDAAAADWREQMESAARLKPAELGGK
jgi:predicted DNA-binding transcriptional regulator AlpA